MKKFYLLLMAVVFTLAASAGTKNLLKMDFESGTPAELGWKSANLPGGMSITGDEWGNYFQFALGQNNGRSCYNTWGSDLYTDQLAEGKYHVEFEWAYAQPANNQFGTEISLFSGTGPAANNASLYGKDNTLFSVTESADNHELFFINGDATNTFAVTGGAWFKVLMDVDVTARKIEWSIVDQLTGETQFAAGTREFAEGTDMLVAGMNIYDARYWSVVQLDNLKIQVITETDIANKPTIALTGVNNEERTYSITFQEEEVLHVKGTDGTETEVYYGDTEGGVYKYITTTSGTLEAWTTSGTATSEKESVAVDCSIIQLPEATATITNASVGFAKEYTITVSNEDVPTKPTLYLSYEVKDENGNVTAKGEDKFSGEVVAVEGKGTLTIQTIALGFATTTVTVENNIEYIVKHDIDFQHMTGDELAAKGFVKLDDLDSESTSGETNWTGRKYMYYKIDSGEKDDDQNIIWTNVPVYGPSTQGYEPIQRYKFYQSKLTEEVAHTLFNPVYTWYYNDGITPTSCDENGVPLISDPAEHPDLPKMIYGVGGTVNIGWKVGIGMIISGVQGDEETYDPAGAGYGNIRVNTGILTVDGLTDEDVIIASTIANYGNDSKHPEFAAGTDSETAIAQYKASHLGLPHVLKGTENITFHRVDEAVSRILVLSPGSTTGIQTLPYNQVVSDHNAPVYNLNGVQVNPNALQKGIYIKQGKKFIVR